MALSRKLLTGIGLTAEQVDSIIEAHTETVDALKAERDDYKAKADKSTAYEKEIADLKKAAEDGGKDAYKVKYEAIKEDFEQYKADIEAKATKATLETAYKKLLKEAGVSEKRIESVLRVSDLSNVKLDKEGKVEDADKLTEAIKTEWADFITDVQKQGANTSTPPQNAGGVDYSKMSDDEYYAAMEAQKKK